METFFADIVDENFASCSPDVMMEAVMSKER